MFPANLYTITNKHTGAKWAMVATHYSQVLQVMQVITSPDYIELSDYPITCIRDIKVKRS